MSGQRMYVKKDQVVLDLATMKAALAAADKAAAIKALQGKVDFGKTGQAYVANDEVVLDRKSLSEKVLAAAVEKLQANIKQAKIDFGASGKRGRGYVGSSEVVINAPALQLLIAELKAGKDGKAIADKLQTMLY